MITYNPFGNLSKQHAQNYLIQRVINKILLGPGILVKLATYKLSLFTFCLPSQGRQTQLVGCKFGLNTKSKQNLGY